MNKGFYPSIFRGEVRLASLCDVDNHLSDRVIKGKRLFGPGLIVPDHDTCFRRCIFITSDKNSLFTIVEDEEQLIVGPIWCSGVQFVECEITGLGIICSREYRETMLNDLARGNEWSGV